MISKVEIRCFYEFFSVEILVEEVKRRKEINDQVQKIKKKKKLILETI